MFVLPSHLRLAEALTVLGRWRRISDLGNKVCGCGLRNPVKELAKERRSEDHAPAKSEPEQDTFAIRKPSPFLIGGEFDAAEVGIKLYN